MSCDDQLHARDELFARAGAGSTRGAQDASLRAQLRAGTEHAHTALDRALQAEGIFTSPDAYARFLRGMHAVHAPVEATLLRSASYRALVPDAEQRARAQRALDDLEALGLPATLAAPPSPARLEGRGALLGAAYVFEGSTLGGQQIRRRLSTQLGIPDEALTYVSGYGSRTGARWKSFVAFLDSGRLTPPERRAAVSTAEGLFLRLRSQLLERP